MVSVGWTAKIPRWGYFYRISGLIDASLLVNSRDASNMSPVDHIRCIIRRIHIHTYDTPGMYPGCPLMTTDFIQQLKMDPSWFCRRLQHWNFRNSPIFFVCLPTMVDERQRWSLKNIIIPRKKNMRTTEKPPAKGTPNTAVRTSNGNIALVLYYQSYCTAIGSTVGQ